MRVRLLRRVTAELLSCRRHFASALNSNQCNYTSVPVHFLDHYWARIRVWIYQRIKKSSVLTYPYSACDNYIFLLTYFLRYPGSSCEVLELWELDAPRSRWNDRSATSSTLIIGDQLRKALTSRLAFWLSRCLIYVLRTLIQTRVAQHGNVLTCELLNASPRNNSERGQVNVVPRTCTMEAHFPATSRVNQTLRGTLLLFSRGACCLVSRRARRINNSGGT